MELVPPELRNKSAFSDHLALTCFTSHLDHVTLVNSEVPGKSGLHWRIWRSFATSRITSSIFLIDFFFPTILLKLCFAMIIILTHFSFSSFLVYFSFSSIRNFNTGS